MSMQSPKHHAALVGPRGIGQLFGAALRHYRMDFGFLLTASICVLVPYFVLDAIFNANSAKILAFDFSHLTHVTSLTQLAAMEQHAGITGPSPVSWVLSLLNAVLVTPLLYGIIVHMVVRRNMGGSSVSMPNAFSHAFHRVGAAALAVLWADILKFFTVIAGGFIIGLAGAIVTAAAGSSVWSTVVAGILAAALLCCVIVVAVKLAFVVPVAYEENLRTSQSARRSAQLTKGQLWRTLVFMLLTVVLPGAIRIVISALIASVTQNAWVILVIIDLVQLFLVPFTLLAMSVLYVDLRIRAAS
ncbi:glycerophosphoryl diester phosphodiesterase membrane domain-containing protein [Alicyclobacillus cycloheptanicus]|jgi:hypothetical protein|uniref:Glycerophosphoryl diester phosphodiesterase membrane domain-containing protein n=1 Tax=Alicyclobacillus cycloheptanicus TaxID=1457 RepID=A0ABT9XFV3_9BACL|nr:hypothetical protein [Alicyclobacillus cycloheptanicus]MDQ0189174.1 hypothetical protein [Alicyclobacillus cycloheptanicus]WDM00362.1 glycerophosphoryl diester phosphodiesterase membrane domain-containing protein [Alicyclobacillus cycloheptanicus]